MQTFPVVETLSRLKPDPTWEAPSSDAIFWGRWCERKGPARPEVEETGSATASWIAEPFYR